MYAVSRRKMPKYIESSCLAEESHGSFLYPECIDSVAIFAMIGAPLGTQKQRTSSSIGLGISIIVIFIYYAIMTLTTGLGKGGVMNPLLACIIPNLICLGAGVFLLQKKNA